MEVFGTKNVIPTDAPFNPKIEHALVGKIIDRGPTVDGKTSVVIQGARPGELIYQILDEPFIRSQPKSSPAPYSAPSAGSAEKVA